MKKPFEYVFVKATPDDIAERVNQLIERGMRPLGTPVMISGTMIGQALVGRKTPFLMWTPHDPKADSEQFQTFSESWRAELDQFTYALANGTLDDAVLPCDTDYSCVFREPGLLRQVFAIWANVMSFDMTGTPANATEARRRAAEYLRAYIDPTYETTPFEDWELELYV